MQLHWVRLVNVAKYRDTRVDFDRRGLFALFGTNGIGKSHLICAPMLLLWGSMPKGKKMLSLYDVITWGEKEAMVEAELTHMGQRYYAWRKGKATGKDGKNKTAKAELYKMSADGVRDESPLAGPSVSDFDEKVHVLFGQSDVFLASVLSAQKASGDLLESEKDKRYNIFTEMIGAKRLLEIEELAKDKLKEVNQHLAQLAQEITRLKGMAGVPHAMREQLRELEEQERQARDQIERLEEDYGVIEKDLVALQDRQRQRQNTASNARAWREALSRDLANLNELRRQVTEGQAAADQLDGLRRRLASHQENEKKLETMRQQAQAHDALVRRSTDISGQMGIKAAQIQNEESQLTRDEQRLAQLSQRHSQLIQVREEYQKAQALENERRQRYSAISTDLSHNRRRLEELRQQASLLASIPCQTIPRVAAELSQHPCHLLTAAMAAARQVPAYEQAVARLEQQYQAVATPVTVPPYNPIEHDQIVRELTQIGNLEQRKLALGSAKREARELGYELEEVNAQIQACPFDQQALNQLIQLVEQSNDLSVRIARAETVSAALPRLREQVASAETSLAEVEGRVREAEGELQKLEAISPEAVSQAQNLLREAEDNIRRERQQRDGLLVRAGTLEQQIVTSEKLVRECGLLEKQEEALRAKAGRLNELKTIFSKKGVLPLLISQAAPEIEALVNEMLVKRWPELGQLMIDTGAQGAETLEIVVQDAKGIHPIDMYSGGEWQILRIALRLAIGRWRAMRSGQVYDMLGFDETFDALAPENSEKIIQLLEGMLDFVAQIMVISHTEDTVAAFDDRLELTRTGGQTMAHWRN